MTQLKLETIPSQKALERVDDSLLRIKTRFLRNAKTILSSNDYHDIEVEIAAICLLLLKEAPNENDREKIQQRAQKCHQIIGKNSALMNFFRAFLITASSVFAGTITGAALGATLGLMNPVSILTGAIAGAMVGTALSVAPLTFFQAGLQKRADLDARFTLLENAVNAETPKAF